MGRCYTLTSYLHEQSDDLGKSLVLFKRGERLGSEGLYWLLLHAANTFGYDKVSLDERVEWALQRWDQLVEQGESPTLFMVNWWDCYWLEADKPWNFLAVCRELRDLQRWTEAGYEQEDFVSGLPVAIDGH